MRISMLKLMISYYFFTTACTHQHSTDFLYEIDGQKVRADELPLNEQQKIYESQKKHYELIQGIVGERVLQKHFEEYSKKHNITVDEAKSKLLELEKQDEEKMKKFYAEGLKSSFQVPYESLSGRLKKMLVLQYQEQVRSDLLAKIEADKNIHFPYPEPEAPKLNVTTEGFPFTGPADAKIILVEYLDYSCLFCKGWKPKVDQLAKDFPNNLKIVYKFFPAHEQEQLAKQARLALCAFEHNVYDVYTDYVFANQYTAAMKSTEHYAELLKITAKTLNTCVKKHTSNRTVENNYLEAQKLGINSVPSFILNGRSIPKGASINYIRRKIEELK